MAKIKELIDMMNKLENEEIEVEEFVKYFKENIKIKNFLPVSQKIDLINKTLTFVSENYKDADFVYYNVMTECIFKLNILFAYSNIDRPKKIDETLYNQLGKCGLTDYVIDDIGADYIELREIFNKMFIYSCLKSISDMMNPAQMQPIIGALGEVTSALKDGKGLETLHKLVGTK